MQLEWNNRRSATDVVVERSTFLVCFSFPHNNVTTYILQMLFFFNSNHPLSGNSFFSPLFQPFFFVPSFTFQSFPILCDPLENVHLYWNCSENVPKNKLFFYSDSYHFVLSYSRLYLSVAVCDLWTTENVLAFFVWLREILLYLVRKILFAAICKFKVVWGWLMLLMYSSWFLSRKPLLNWLVYVRTIEV